MRFKNIGMHVQPRLRNDQHGEGPIVPGLNEMVVAHHSGFGAHGCRRVETVYRERVVAMTVAGRVQQESVVVHA